ncbi:MAG TPA: hypothetical protein VF116_14880 [Ktedonobacterales bacterium]
MANEQQQQNTSESDQQQQAAGQRQSANDSGLPGGGVGRKEGPFNTPVYPVSADSGASGDAQVENENAWGQGQRGAAGYQDSGGSSLDDIGQRERQDEQRAGQQGGQSSDQQSSQQASQQ